MKQHIRKMHSDVLGKNSLPSKLSSNYIDTSPGEFNQSLPITSDLTQENIDSNTCLSVSDALKTGEKCDRYLDVTQKHGDCMNTNLLPSPKFIQSNEEHLEQSLDLNSFSSNSTHIFYTCHLCQRRYTSQSFLNKHVKTYHNINELNEAAKSDVSYNEISDSSKFSGTNNSEPNQSLLDIPFENINETFGDYISGNLEAYNSNPLSSDFPFYQHKIPNVKKTGPKEHDIPNLDTAAEIKGEYSDRLLTTDCKINQDSCIPLNFSPSHSIKSEQSKSTQDNLVDSKNDSEIPVNFKQLPRFTCRICLKTYTGKVYFRKHYKTKHNRMVSNKQLEAWQNFSGLKKEENETVNHCSRRLSLEASKSNYSGINDLLSAEARSNEKVMCKICNKRYSCRGNLKIHMKNVHNYRGLRQRIVEGNKKEVQCHICLKLLQNTSLKTHVQTVHGDGFLTEEQEAFTVSNVAALSALNYCAENVQPTLSNLDDLSDSTDLSSSKFIGTDSNILNPSNQLPENEFKSLSKEKNVSNIDYLNSLEKMTYVGETDLSTSKYNDLHKEVIDVSSHKKFLIESSDGSASKLEFELQKRTDTKAVYDLDLESKLNNQNIMVDESDFDDFSLSDIPTSEDECTNLMDSVVLQTKLMENSTTSEWAAKNNSFLNFEDQHVTSFESNHKDEPIAVTDKNVVGECITDDKIDELLNSQTKLLPIVEKELSTSPSSNSIPVLTESESNKDTEKIELLSTIPETPIELESCKHLEEMSTSLPETLTEFNIADDKNFIQGMDTVSDLELEEATLKSVCPVENFKPDLNICSTESSTDDEFTVPLEKLSDADNPEKINSTISTNVKESKTSYNECRFCHKMFSTMKFLSKHLKIFHNIPLLKKQKSTKRKPERDEKLSPPLLTQHQNYTLGTLPPSSENSQSCLQKSVFENENKFNDVSNEISKCNNIDSLLDDYTNQLNCSEDRTLSLHSSDPELICENVIAIPTYTSDTTNIGKEVSVDCEFEPHKKLKLSVSSDIEISADTDSVTLNVQNNLESDTRKMISVCNILDSSRDDTITNNFKADHVFRPVYDGCEVEHVSHPASDNCEIERVSPSVFDDCETEPVSHPVSDNHEIEHPSHPVSDDHNSEPTSHPISDDPEIARTSNSIFDDHVKEHQDKMSKAPILPCIIKVLKNEQNAIIYQIDKSKGDESSSNSVNSESKSSPSLKRFFMKNNYRKKLNKNPSLYSRQKSLMRRRRRPRSLLVGRRKIVRTRKKRPKPIVQTFKYPNDVISFLKNNKQPVVLLTRLKEETLAQTNCNNCVPTKENEKHVIVRLEKCDVLNMKCPPQCEPADITELSFSSSDRFIPNEACTDNISINPVMKFSRNSDVQETTNLAVVLHKLKIDVNSTVLPLCDDFEISTYKSCVQSPILKECRVVLTKLQL